MTHLGTNSRSQRQRECVQEARSSALLRSRMRAYSFKGSFCTGEFKHRWKFKAHEGEIFVPNTWFEINQGFSNKVGGAWPDSLTGLVVGTVFIPDSHH